MATPQTRFSAADRRQQILDLATRLFAEQGFRGTTTRLIAERSGVTEALIFRHFPSKEDLYWAVIWRKIESAAPIERLRENLEAGGSDLDILSRVALQVLERRSKDQTLSRLLLFSALEKHELSERLFRNYVADYFEVLASFVRQGIAAGRFRPVDPLLAARGFLGMVIYHSWVQELYGGKKVQEFDARVVSRTLADIWLAGMHPHNLRKKSRSLSGYQSRPISGPQSRFVSGHRAGAPGRPDFGLLGWFSDVATGPLATAPLGAEGTESILPQPVKRKKRPRRPKPLLRKLVKKHRVV